MICPTCGEEVIAIICRRQRGRTLTFTAKNQEALDAVLLAMHNKLAGHQPIVPE